MQIRTRLTLQFLLLGGLIMIIASVAIYYPSTTYVRENFYDRLTNKAWILFKLLLDTYGYDAERVRMAERNNPVKLQNEKIIVLDFKNEIIYTSDENGEIEIRNEFLERVRSSERE